MPTLILAGVLALAVLLAAGWVWRGRGSWTILALTGLALPWALFVSVWATGIGHPSGHLDLAKFFLPYMVVPFALHLVTEDGTAMTLCFWLPTLQVLAYGVTLAHGWFRRRFWRHLAWVLAVHGLVSAAVFALHRSQYLDGQ